MRMIASKLAEVASIFKKCLSKITIFYLIFNKYMIGLWMDNEILIRNRFSGVMHLFPAIPTVYF